MSTSIATVPSRALGFHARHAWFNMREQFSDLASGLIGFLLYPFFIWLLGRIWLTYNSRAANYTLQEVMLYVAMTEILFMTFLRSNSLNRASSDFSLALARPRSWMAMSFSGIYGRCLGSRLVFLCVFAISLPFLGIGIAEGARAALRLLLFLPFLGVVQGLMGLMFAAAQVRWHETSYMVLPVSKVFLALGGVFGPLVDYGEPLRSWLLLSPASDVFFQVGHYCVRGEFYGMSALTWFLRVTAFSGVMMIFNWLMFRSARRHHQSYGG